MRAVRLVEAVGATFFLGLAAWAWLSVLGLPLGYFGDLFRNLLWLAAVLEVVGLLFAIDAVLGSRLLEALYGAWARRSAVLPYELRLGRYKVRVGNPEALKLSLPFWLSTALLAASLRLSVAAPTPVFALQFAMLSLSTLAATWLTLKGLLEDPLSVHIRRAGAWRRIAALVPWYSRLASLSLRGRRPLLTLASAIQDSRPLRLLERLSLEAGLPFTRRELALILVSTPVAAALAALGVVLAAWGLLAVSTGVFTPALLLALPLAAALAAPAALLVYVLHRRESRARAAEGEMAWLAMAGVVSSRAGLGLDHALQQMASSEFPGLSFEARELRRRVEVLGEDPLTAVKSLGETHPSKRFSEMLTGYSSLVLSGGSPVSYLRDWSRELLLEHRLSMNRFALEANSLVDVALVLLVLGPIVALTGGLLLGLEALAAMRLYVFVLLPMLFLASMLLALQAPQRRARYDLKRPLALGLSTGGLAFLALALLDALGPGAPLWLGLGLPALAFLIGYYIPFRVQELEEAEEEAWLPYVLRRLAEAKRLGKPLLAALEELASELRGRAVHVSQVLAETAARLRVEGALEPPSTSRSWLWRVGFRLLSVLEASGGGTAADVEAVRRFVESWAAAWREARSSMRLAVAITVLAPAILSFTVWAVEAGMARVEALLKAAGPVLGYTLEVPPPEAFELARASVVLSSLMLSLVVSS